MLVKLGAKLTRRWGKGISHVIFHRRSTRRGDDAVDPAVIRAEDDAELLKLYDKVDSMVRSLAPRTSVDPCASVRPHCQPGFAPAPALPSQL